jgi:two-component system chemotaxis response regulator CheY
VNLPKATPDNPGDGMECSAKLPMRVLIADDQRNVGTTLAAMVSEFDHEVVEVVGSGFEAIQAYHRHRPDVVLMDYYMPHLNGATACRNILSRYPAANVILVSGVVGAETLNHSGAMAVLSKPIDLARLKILLTAPSSPADESPV